MAVATSTARDLGHAHVVSRQPRTLPAEDEADEKTVTESNLRLRVPAQVTADLHADSRSVLG
jgi:hypothetical protein